MWVDLIRWLYDAGQWGETCRSLFTARRKQCLGEFVWIFWDEFRRGQHALAIYWFVIVISFIVISFIQCTQEIRVLDRLQSPHQLRISSKAWRLQRWRSWIALKRRGPMMITTFHTCRVWYILPLAEKYNPWTITDYELRSLGPTTEAPKQMSDARVKDAVPQGFLITPVVSDDEDEFLPNLPPFKAESLEYLVKTGDSPPVEEDGRPKRTCLIPAGSIRRISKPKRSPRSVTQASQHASNHYGNTGW